MSGEDDTSTVESEDSYHNTNPATVSPDPSRFSHGDARPISYGARMLQRLLAGREMEAAEPEEANATELPNIAEPTSEPTQVSEPEEASEAGDGDEPNRPTRLQDVTDEGTAYALVVRLARSMEDRLFLSDNQLFGLLAEACVSLQLDRPDNLLRHERRARLLRVLHELHGAATGNLLNTCLNVYSRWIPTIGAVVGWELEGQPSIVDPCAQPVEYVDDEQNEYVDDEQVEYSFEDEDEFEFTNEWD